MTPEDRPRPGYTGEEGGAFRRARPSAAAPAQSGKEKERGGGGDGNGDRVQHIQSHEYLLNLKTYALDSADFMKEA